MNKKMNVPMKFELTNEVLNKNFHKVKLYVCHNGVNLNESHFSDGAIARASKSLQNIPILAYIERDEDGKPIQFGGHEIEYTLEEKDGEFYFKEHFLEVPIGVIPSQNEYAIESVDGKNYVTCIGYIWKNYANEAYDLLLENDVTDVSMEIGVYDFKFLNDGVIDILEYEYEGVTVIGCDPAMVGAKIQMSFSKDNNKEYEERVKELDELLANFSLLKGGENVEDNNMIEQSQEDIIEEPQMQEFAEEEEKDEENVCPECGKPQDECECGEEEIEEEFQQETESESEEPQEEKLYSQSEMDEAIANTKAEFAQALEELEELRKFKADYDKALEVQKINDEMDNLVSSFNCDENLVKELREKVLNKEISMENFELQLWRNNQVSKKEFNNKEKQSNKLPVIDNENKISDIDSLFDYYGVPKRK